MQKYAIFVKKNLKINMLKIKGIIKLDPHSIYNLKYIIPASEDYRNFLQWI